MERKAFMCDMIRTELEDIVGVENVSTKDSDRATYGVDYFWIGRMWVDHGLTPPMPDIIVRPGCTEEVSKILKIANYYKIPVNIWGGGSGSQGGALPMAGGIMMDMKRMSHLIEIDEVSRTITAEAGMIFQQLEWYANERGYSCQHIPSCLTCGTIGGALGHRGIGIMSSKYGKIDDMCISMEVVLPNGDIINTLPVPKHAAGPDLNEIFIGSEGTLGVITKATFKLFEQPESRQHRAFLFPDMHSGYMAGRDIMQKVKPSILRFFDEAETVSIIKKILGFEKKGCFMNVTLEGMKKIVDIELEIVEEIAAKWGAQDLGGEYGEKWYENRITFFYPGNIMDIPQMFGTMDTVATYANIEKIYLGHEEGHQRKIPLCEVHLSFQPLVRVGLHELHPFHRGSRPRALRPRRGHPSAQPDLERRCARGHGKRRRHQRPSRHRPEAVPPDEGAVRPRHAGHGEPEEGSGSQRHHEPLQAGPVIFTRRKPEELNPRNAKRVQGIALAGVVISNLNRRL